MGNQEVYPDMVRQVVNQEVNQDMVRQGVSQGMVHQVDNLDMVHPRLQHHITKVNMILVIPIIWSFHCRFKWKLPLVYKARISETHVSLTWNYA